MLSSRRRLHTADSCEAETLEHWRQVSSSSETYLTTPIVAASAPDLQALFPGSLPPRLGGRVDPRSTVAASVKLGHVGGPDTRLRPSTEHDVTARGAQRTIHDPGSRRLAQVSQLAAMRSYGSTGNLAGLGDGEGPHLPPVRTGQVRPRGSAPLTDGSQGLPSTWPHDATSMQGHKGVHREQHAAAYAPSLSSVQAWPVPLLLDGPCGTQCCIRMSADLHADRRAPVLVCVETLVLVQKPTPSNKILLGWGVLRRRNSVSTPCSASPVCGGH